MQNKIIHIMMLDKFNIPFIKFINEHFDKDNHLFIFLQKKQYKYDVVDEDCNIIWIDTKFKNFRLEKEFYLSKRIIIHGLWKSELIKLLFIQPWLLKKVYWVMWGGDFYFPEKQRWLKKQVIKRIGHFVSYIKGDYELIQQWYGVRGEYHECFMYTSNLYKEYDIKKSFYKTINIQLGNSADLTNNHLVILNKLERYKDENIKIYVPLSYSGNKEYINSIILKGKKIFGDKFIPMTDFMPFEQYLEFLGKIDIAIFAHKRQQAMGNIITLLGLGKKVYTRSDITPWKLFKDINVKVYDIDHIELNLIDKSIKKSNQEKIKNYFSKENYLQQLKNLFGDN